jgi:hypothetical protein
MNTYCVVLALLAVFVASEGFGQQKASRPKTKPKIYTITVRPGEDSIPDPVPRLQDFAIVATLDPDGKARVGIQVDEASPGVGADDLRKIFQCISTPQTQHANPIIIIKPVLSVRYDTIRNFAQRLRDYGENRIRIETTNGHFIVVPAKQKKAREVKPNPLFLLLEVKGNLDISVNNEPTGSLNDLSGLRNFLSEIFEARAVNGVFREGTDEVETTVHLTLPLTLSFSDVCKIDEALRQAGSDRVFLRLDAESPLQRKIIEIRSTLR